jgi:hypothetical protein
MKINQFNYKFSFFLYCAIAGQVGYAQKAIPPAVVSTAGEISRSGGITLEWTLGETFVESGKDQSTWLTQGYHQPMLLVKENTQSSSSAYDVKIFPNPTLDILHVLIRTNLSDDLVFKIMDVTGRTVFMQEASGGSNDIKLKINELPEGMFVLTVMNRRGNWIRSFKVIKHS